MPGNIHNHIKQEQTTWLKTLEGLRQENVFLKNKLAEIVKDNVSRELLEKAEYFNNIFLDKDTVISLLRRDIAQLAVKIADSANHYVLMELERKKLSNDISRMKQEFFVVKTAFNKFLSEEMQD